MVIFFQGVKPPRPHLQSFKQKITHEPQAVTIDDRLPCPPWPVGSEFADESPIKTKTRLKYPYVLCGCFQK